MFWDFFIAYNVQVYVPYGIAGQFPIKLHEKLKRTSDLRIPLKPLLHLHFVSLS